MKCRADVSHASRGAPLMHEIAQQLQSWHASGRPFALASVVGAAGGEPREPGAALAVDAAGEAVGSISGGCVEGAVYELCRKAIATGRPALERFGFIGEDAVAVGLPRGAALEVFIQAVVPGGAPGLAAALACIVSGTPVALARAIAGPQWLLGTTVAVTAAERIGGGALPPSADHHLVTEARTLLHDGRNGTTALHLGGGAGAGPAGAVTFFVESYAPAPRMLVFGAVDFASAMVRIGRFLGYHVTVCDARTVFATRRRFPDADEVVADWPHRYLDAQRGRIDGRTVLCVLTQDPKFDFPLLERALRLPIGYVGAMGSPRTRRERDAGLRARGLTDAELARLRTPIGLDLGARTPEETAIAVAAEIVAHRRGGGCLPLSDRGGLSRGDQPPYGRPRRDLLRPVQRLAEPEPAL
jgi:xanthine dehydrogenase accessory factor